MPLLDEKTKRLVEQEFKNLKEPVRLINFTQEIECDYCAETRQLLGQVAELSDLVSLEVYNFQLDKEQAEKYQVDKIPATVILAGEEDFGFRYYGIPAGYEFSVLVNMIVSASQRDSGLAEPIRQELKKLEKDLEVQVFVTPTCPYCPRAAIAGGRIALESPKVRTSVIEAGEFPHLAQKYGVMGVPKVIISEVEEFVGALPEIAFVQHLLSAQERVKKG